MKDTKKAEKLISLMSDIKTMLYARELTTEEKEAHEEAGEGFHVPAIVHRSGGVSAKLLNACGICGAQIVPNEHGWIAVSEETADKMREATDAR